MLLKFYKSLFDDNNFLRGLIQFEVAETQDRVELAATAATAAAATADFRVISPVQNKIPEKGIGEKTFTHNVDGDRVIFWLLTRDKVKFLELL